MKPLSPRNLVKCEKCGFTEDWQVDFGFYSKVIYRYVGTQEFGVEKYAEDCKCSLMEVNIKEKNKPVFVEEHIERTCPRCGFI